MQLHCFQFKEIAFTKQHRYPYLPGTLSLWCGHTLMQPCMWFMSGEHIACEFCSYLTHSCTGRALQAAGAAHAAGASHTASAAWRMEGPLVQSAQWGEGSWWDCSHSAYTIWCAAQGSHTCTTCSPHPFQGLDLKHRSLKSLLRCMILLHAKMGTRAWIQNNLRFCTKSFDIYDHMEFQHDTRWTSVQQNTFRRGMETLQFKVLAP